MKGLKRGVSAANPPCQHKKSVPHYRGAQLKGAARYDAILGA